MNQTRNKGQSGSFSHTEGKKKNTKFRHLLGDMRKLKRIKREPQFVEEMSKNSKKQRSTRPKILKGPICFYKFQTNFSILDHIWQL